jgi:murein L,D-transpeptidase YafK
MSWKNLLGITVIFVLMSSHVFGMEKADKVLVVKSKKKMYLKKDDKILKEYNIALGTNPKGPKCRYGDEKTPEGWYILDYKKEKSGFYKSIHISYPNDHDMEQAEKLGVRPGGMIMIHGQRNGLEGRTAIIQRFNWTTGCIAVTNRDMDEIWKTVETGTPIEILP